MSGITEIIIRKTLNEFREQPRKKLGANQPAIAPNKQYDDLLVATMHAHLNKQEQSGLKTYFAEANKYLVETGKYDGNTQPHESDSSPISGEDDSIPTDALLTRFLRRIFKKLQHDNPELALDLPAQPLIEEAQPAQLIDESLLTEEEREDAALLAMLPNVESIMALFAESEAKDAIIKATEDELRHVSHKTEADLNTIRNRHSVIAKKPEPEGINPMNAGSNITGGIDNTFSTALDRIMKLIINLTSSTSSASQVASTLHIAFSWVGLGVGFLYSFFFAGSYLLRKFYKKEDVVLGARDMFRIILSALFLAITIAATFTTLVGIGPLFTLGFPILAAISGFFSVGEHLYDYHYGNVKALEQAESDATKLTKEIRVIKSSTKIHEEKLARTPPASKEAKELRKTIRDLREQLDDKAAALEKTVHTIRDSKEAQIRLRDPIAIASSATRAVLVTLTIVGAVLTLNPATFIIGMSIVAAMGVVGLILFGVGIYNKHRLDKKFEAEAQDIVHVISPEKDIAPQPEFALSRTLSSPRMFAETTSRHSAATRELKKEKEEAIDSGSPADKNTISTPHSRRNTPTFFRLDDDRSDDSYSNSDNEAAPLIPLTTHRQALNGSH